MNRRDFFKLALGAIACLISTNGDDRHSEAAKDVLCRTRMVAENFTEKFAGFQRQMQNAIINERINTLHGTAAQFNQKFGVATHGRVIMAGRGDAGGYIIG